MFMNSKERKLQKEREAREKRRAEEKRIAKALSDISTHKEKLEAFAKKCYQMALDAARKGGARNIAKDYLKTSAEMRLFATNIETFLNKVEFAIMRSQALEGISDLAGALEACNALFTKHFDFDRVGNSMSSLMGKLDGAQEEFYELMGKLRTTEDENDPYSYGALFDSKDVKNPELDKIYGELEAQLEADLVIGISTVPPVEANVGANAEEAEINKSIDALADMIEDERKG